MIQHPVVRSLVTLLLLLVIASIVFAPVMSLSFLSDDLDMVWGTGRGAATWTHGFFRPLSFLSFRLVRVIAGDQAFAQRIFNVLVHGVNAFLLYRLVFGTLITERAAVRQWAAWSAAVLFIVYPYHQEAIVWIVGRYPSLATLFVLCTLLVVMSERGVLRWPLAGLSFLLALMSYEIAVCLPILALPLLRERTTDRRHWLITSVVVLMIWSIGRVWATGHLANAYLGEVIGHDPLTWLTGVPKVLARLVLPPSDDAQRWILRFALLALAAAGLAWRSYPLPGNDRGTGTAIRTMLWMLVVGSWLALLGGVSTRTSESDRFLYLPSVFLCGLFGCVLARVGRPAPRWALLVALLTGSFFALRENHRHWIIASLITSTITDEVKRVMPHGPLTIVAVPEEHEGAYILRHGATALLLLNDIDTARIHFGPPVPRSAMIASGMRDLIDTHYDQGSSIGRLEPDTSNGSGGRFTFRWEP